MQGIRQLRRLCLVAGLLTYGMAAKAGPLAELTAKHPLTVDDVLETVPMDRIAPSPNGDTVAVVIPRPAHAGETAGRNAYETDPSRSDVWLIPRQGGKPRQLTSGAATASGYWCATWSPDGRMLAMLSTAPQGEEPRGGDNVRLYVWDSADGNVRRLSAAGVMTQGRYGSGLYPLDVRGGADEGSITHSCNEGQENAGFAWLDDHRLLALTLPPGQISALLDQYGRPFDEAARTREMLREGRLPTVTAVGSGEARVPLEEERWKTTLAIIDARTGQTSPVADLPVYPFSGSLSVSIAPDRRSAAILAPIRKFAFVDGVAPPFNNGDWHVEKRLGIVDLATGSRVRWAALPSSARWPLELFDWSPDSRRVALRARKGISDRSSSAFILDAHTLALAGTEAGLTMTTPSLRHGSGRSIALWTDATHLLVKGRHLDGARDDWWTTDRTGKQLNLTAALKEVPAIFRRDKDGALVTIADGRLSRLKAETGALEHVGTWQAIGRDILFPADPAWRSATVLVGDDRTIEALHTASGRTSRPIPRPQGDILATDEVGLLSTEPTTHGLFLRQSSLDGSPSRDLLVLDRHLADVDWGERHIIDYRNASGTQLKAGVILPPGYTPERRYPVLTWVYGGYHVSGLDDYFLDPYMPGIYNLQLYAAHGYVVLIPSIPLAGDGKEDAYAALPGGVMPAIDKLVADGIADPTRVAVMGQSFGGYTVYALVSQSDRFRAGIAVAGIVDPAQAYGQFDPSARGYPGIEDEKSEGWSIYENGDGSPPPYLAPDYWAKASALAHVDRVRTPLLMIHGELDIRDPLAQVEPFYFALSRQGKTARFLRYWGENHSLAASPANVRDVYRETLAWLDRFDAPRFNGTHP